jgi:hypothetical protein
VDDVARRIIAAGGENHSRFVGVIDYPLSSWYILNDGTCMQVTPAQTGEAGRDVVGQLVLGEPGRGRERWERQRRRVVDCVDLR